MGFLSTKGSLAAALAFDSELGHVNLVFYHLTAAVVAVKED